MIHMIQTDRDGSYLSKFDGEKAVRLKKLKKRYEHISCSELGNSSGGNGGLYYCFPSPKSDDLNFDLIDIDNNLIKITTVQRNFPIRSADYYRSHSEDVLV